MPRKGGWCGNLEQGSGDTVRNSKAESTSSVEAANTIHGAGSKDFGVHAGCRAAYREPGEHAESTPCILHRDKLSLSFNKKTNEKRESKVYFLIASKIMKIRYD